MAERSGIPPREIFLSHSSRDQAFAATLVNVLRRHGVPVWFSSTNLLGAQEWHDEIGDALNRCDWFAVVLSPDSIKSPWVKRELMFALRDPKYGARIIPILHRPCDGSRLSWTLPSYQFVDFTVSWAAGFAALLKIWGLGYQPDPADSPRRPSRGRRSRG